MKKWILIAGIVLLLTGCGAQPTFETLSDVYAQPAAAQQEQICLSLPQDAAVMSIQNEEAGTLYFCNGYTAAVQVLPGGDLERTLLQTTGFGTDAISLLQTKNGEHKRYDGVWAAAGEDQPQLCRIAILDDGSYHYVLTCMAGYDRTEDLQPQWQALFRSFTLGSEQLPVRTGS